MGTGSFDWHEAGLTVGQVAGRSGVAPSALRFYERQGLITSDRTAGNQRRYHGDILCRVAMIRACQRVGLSIAEIRTARPNCPKVTSPDPRTGTAYPSGSRPSCTTASMTSTVLSTP